MECKSEVRYCQDIGMFVIDRPRRISCIFATAFCKKTCFNNSIEAVFKCKNKDIRNEKYWQNLDGKKLKKDLRYKQHQTKRFRLMSRGEAFKTTSDIDKVIDLLDKNKTMLFWIPTRAWRSKKHRERIEKEIMPRKNARIQASLDPSNTQLDYFDLIKNGWSTMFYGDNEIPLNYGEKCAKTWQHKKGHCAKCINQCFSAKRTDTWLKQH